MQVLSPAKQYRFTLHNVRVGYTTVHRTHRRARFVIVKAHTLRTLLWHDVEDVVGERRGALPLEFPAHPPPLDGGVGGVGRPHPPPVALATHNHCHTTT